MSLDQVEDEIASASSLSDADSDREETPDLYRNSSLGLLEGPQDDEFSEDSEDGKSPTPAPAHWPGC